MSSIVFISFDIKKDEYPSMSYSIAAMIASLKRFGQTVNHFSFDLQHALEEKESKETITDRINQRLSENFDHFSRFDYIAISVTAWSVEYTYTLLNFLHNYKGKVILGGYEITSMSEAELLESFPRADYFIKGFAETALKKLLVDKIEPTGKVLSVDVLPEDLVSPYLTNILNTFSRKVYWETKRGCPHKCGFCEWGKATKSIFEIDKDRLLSEIELFKKSGISDINILDGTFNWGRNFLFLFEQLLDIKDLKITCQIRFEDMLAGKGADFFEVCKLNKNRVHLEFGLQTIHPLEMENIERKNDMNKVIQVLQQLKDHGIDYEVSIIYAIPGQTVETFIDTIEFLITSGCKDIKAYPLRIPKNSDLNSNKEKFDVLETKNELNVPTVLSSYSFSKEQRIDMEIIAQRLNNGQLIRNYNENSKFEPPESFKITKTTPYQWAVKSIDVTIINQLLVNRIISDYLNPTLNEIFREDSRQYLMWLGTYNNIGSDKNRMHLINGFITGKKYMKLKRLDLPEESEDKRIQNMIDSINPNIQPRKYFCRVRLSRSGNIYIIREVVKSE